MWMEPNVKPIYIFLDIDGVLNNTEYFSDINNENPNNRWFCPKLTKRLNDVILFIETNIKRKVHVVLSSSHRTGNPENDKNYLSNAGVIGNFHGSTPRTRSISIYGNDFYIPRGLEIKHYIDNSEVENYIILDDDSDMLYEQKDYFVHIEDGLLDSDIKKIIEISKKFTD